MRVVALDPLDDTVVRARIHAERVTQRRDGLMVDGVHAERVGTKDGCELR